VSPQFQSRLQYLQDPAHLKLLGQIRRGVEKESLRMSGDGKLAQTDHPAGLGSALTNTHITTDYSEALLEFITPPSADIDETLQTLDDIHRFVYAQIGDELLWGASMPCLVEGDEGIPVARYGSSNIATMKTVYRYGLGHRYGRLMQAIAGIHYNFSMPSEYWPLAQAADGDKGDPQAYITERYLGLIRNFQRYSWLLIYLFGASPAVCRSFVRDNPNHHLQDFDPAGKSLYLPYATALRMGDLGYNSNAQKNLEVCYNSLDSYIDTLHGAITQPHREYQAIGTGTGDQRRQLNTSLLQIENEFYSPIWPKRVARSGEIPLGALRRAGIEYIEVRCIDINPFLPLGLEAQQMRFLDTFLLYCLLQDSPPCTEQERSCMAANMEKVVDRGREPGLQLSNCQGDVGLAQWAGSLLQDMSSLAQLLDSCHADSRYVEALADQQAKVADPDLTPSARILQIMRDEDQAWFQVAMSCSTQHAEYFREQPLSPEREAYFRDASAESIQAQAAVEASDEVDFETFLDNYYQQYTHLADNIADNIADKG
jgi:glutamate--cysteine ligase